MGDAISATLRLLLDENLSPATADFLRALGFIVTTVVEEGLSGAPDEEVGVRP
ncbi:MAG: DUF5615 family PIN-like protein [Planctomycetes bacterium]|nr:DUF5615 family PIN-like protein [Planctomycetota bacterium]